MCLYPEYKYFGIEVNNSKYHGHIENGCIFVNLLQPEHDQIITALHELVHAMYDSGDLESLKNVPTLRAEYFARKHAQLDYMKIFKEEA